MDSFSCFVFFLHLISLSIIKVHILLKIQFLFDSLLQKKKKKYKNTCQ